MLASNSWFNVTSLPELVQAYADLGRRLRSLDSDRQAAVLSSPDIFSALEAACEDIAVSTSECRTAYGLSSECLSMFGLTGKISYSLLHSVSSSGARQAFVAYNKSGKASGLLIFQGVKEEWLERLTSTKVVSTTPEIDRLAEICLSDFGHSSYALPKSGRTASLSSPYPAAQYANNWIYVDNQVTGNFCAFAPEQRQEVCATDYLQGAQCSPDCILVKAERPDADEAVFSSGSYMGDVALYELATPAVFPPIELPVDVHLGKKSPACSVHLSLTSVGHDISVTLSDAYCEFAQRTQLHTAMNVAATYPLRKGDPFSYLEAVMYHVAVSRSVPVYVTRPHNVTATTAGLQNFTIKQNLGLAKVEVAEVETEK